MMITYNGKTIILGEDAEYTHRSHINGMQCTEPDNWIHVTGADAEDENDIYDIWYYVEDVNTELEDINWNDPWDVTLRI